MKTQQQKRRFIAGIILSSMTIFMNSCDPTDPSGSSGSNVMLSSCLTGTLQNGLISFYPFNSGNLGDASGNGQDLENITGAMPAADRFGNPSCAYQFGSGDYLRDVNPDYLDGLTTFSISLWYYQDSMGDPGLYRSMVRRDSLYMDSSTDAVLWTISTHDCCQPVFSYDHYVLWYHFEDQQSTCEALMDSLETNWHHLVGVYDNGFVQVWFDGQLTTDDVAIIPCSTPELIPLGDLLFGHQLFGKLDDVAMYDRVLSPLEIQSLYTLAPCCD
jgi:Concanavalin A-like lectin/glucanases superfamily